MQVHVAAETQLDVALFGILQLAIHPHHEAAGVGDLKGLLRLLEDDRKLLMTRLVLKPLVGVDSSRSNDSYLNKLPARGMTCLVLRAHGVTPFGSGSRYDPLSLVGSRQALLRTRQHEEISRKQVSELAPLVSLLEGSLSLRLASARTWPAGQPIEKPGVAFALVAPKWMSELGPVASLGEYRDWILAYLPGMDGRASSPKEH